MKAFKITILILISVFTIDKILYFSIKSIEKEVLTGNGVGKVNHFLKVKDTTQFLVFGSSRANHHIEPLIFGNSSFNMGSGGTNIAYSNALIHTLPKNRKQIILLQFDIDYFFEKNYKGEDIKNLSVKYHQNKIIKNKIDDIQMNNHFSNIIWCLNYNGKLLSILKNKFFPKYDYQTYFGFDPMQNTPEQKEIFKKRLKKSEKVKLDCENYEVGVLNFKFLNDIILFCENNNKSLIVFASPTYYDKCKMDNNIVVELMKNLKVKYLDLTDTFIDKEDLDLWKDETHLSNKGAKIFSKVLYTKIRGNF